MYNEHLDAMKVAYHSVNKEAQEGGESRLKKETKLNFRHI